VARPPGATRSLVLTIDVITPIVDDPRQFGTIAAANSLSDVYAMGGQPELALSFVGLPMDQLPPSVLPEVLAGIQNACSRAGCAVVGGHTIADSEPKCGLAVVGSVAPEQIWTQHAGMPGQALVLTKALGTGLVGHAIKAGTASPAVAEAAIAQMLQLNDVACRVGLEVGATTCTDVTGFGLLGHLKHLVQASGLGARIRATEVPLLDGALELATADCVPGGSRRNLEYAADCTRFAGSIPPPLQLALADAQTSGGLLLGVPADRAAEAVDELQRGGCVRATIIGELVQADEPGIDVA
jgi:selenide,water dikinase